MAELPERPYMPSAASMAAEYARHVPMLVNDANAICEEADTVYDYAVQSKAVAPADVMALRVSMFAAILVHTIAYQIWDDERATQGFAEGSLEWLTTASATLESLAERLVADRHAQRPIWADPEGEWTAPK